MNTPSCLGCHFNDPMKGLRARMRTVQETKEARDRAMAPGRGQGKRLKQISSKFCTSLRIIELTLKLSIIALQCTPPGAASGICGGVGTHTVSISL